jgi:integrating conjugative element protein (TIGR03761 family)
MKNANQTLYNSSVLELHTQQATDLINYVRVSTSGNNKNTIAGLYQFCIKLQQIWQDVRNDNPYAELALIRIETRIEKAFKALRRIEYQLEQLILAEKDKSLKGVQLSMHEAHETIKIELSQPVFFLTHTKLAIRIIAYFDLLLCKLKTCKDFGLINRQRSKSILRRSTTIARGVLDSPNSYKHIDITRSDVLKQVSKAKEAAVTHGMISVEILNYTMQSEHGPEPIQRAKSTV